MFWVAGGLLTLKAGLGIFLRWKIWKVCKDCEHNLFSNDCL